MGLIGPIHSSQFMKQHNSGITTPKHAICAQTVFSKFPENQITNNFIHLTSSNFVRISHIKNWNQFNSWKNFWKFRNGPPCKNKLGLSTLLIVAVYRQSSNTKTCAKKQSQILANNIDNEGRGICFRFVKYCRFN